MGTSGVVAGLGGGLQRIPGVLLFVLAAAELLVGVDFAIVNVAVPSIGAGLGFSREGLPWVMTGLLLPFGGFLLVAGRAADLFGRKRMLVSGLTLLCVASLVAGVATAPWMLLLGRAAQGVASAMVAPAALSLITTNWREGPERDRALGVAGAVLPIGFVVGLVLSGLLTAVPPASTATGASVVVGELRGGRLLHHDDVVAVRVAQHEHERGAGRAHRLRIEVDATDGAQARVLAQDVRRLHTDRAAAGLAAHRRVER